MNQPSPLMAPRPPSKIKLTLVSQESNLQPMVSRGEQASGRTARNGLAGKLSRLWCRLWAPVLILVVTCITALFAWNLRVQQHPKAPPPEIKVVPPPFATLHGVNEFGNAFYIQLRPGAASSRIVFCG